MSKYIDIKVNVDDCDNIIKILKTELQKYQSSGGIDIENHSLIRIHGSHAGKALAKIKKFPYEIL